jgi:hypothetical protein
MDEQMTGQQAAACCPVCVCSEDYTTYPRYPIQEFPDRSAYGFVIVPRNSQEPV